MSQIGFSAGMCGPPVWARAQVHARGLEDVVDTCFEELARGKVPAASLEHLGVVLASLAQRRLGNQFVFDASGALRVVLPGRDLAHFLDLATGQIRRYGCAEPRADLALLRVLENTGAFCVEADDRQLVATQVQLVLEAAEMLIRQQADLLPVRAHADRVLRQLANARS